MDEYPLGRHKVPLQALLSDPIHRARSVSSIMDERQPGKLFRPHTPHKSEVLLAHSWSPSLVMQRGRTRPCSLLHTAEIVPKNKGVTEAARQSNSCLSIYLDTNFNLAINTVHRYQALSLFFTNIACAFYCSCLCFFLLVRSTTDLSLACFQLVLRLTVAYFVFYFLFTLGLLIRKSLELSYPTDALNLDVALLFLLALLEVSLFFCGVKGSLTESEPYCLVHLLLTGGSIVLVVYFLWWQTYVVWADLMLSSVLLILYGLSGVLACGGLARLAKYSHYFR
ncbi:uncharacterized protein [Eucyclogobius newberryi]|uniref:uncharacterized protein n=1 Tax=Eucyclogobius newberryi TaxID=166745 RepID=UPI003B5BDB24